MDAYVVTAGYVTVTTAVPGGRAMRDIQLGDLLPDDVPQEQVDTLLARGAVARVEEELPPASEPPAGPPPKAGKGSGMDAWTAYAHSYGVPVPDGMKRDELVNALAQRGIATE